MIPTPPRPFCIRTGIVIVAVLSGCATPQVEHTGTDEIEQRLADAADTVADSVAKLAIVEQSARGVHAQAITPARLPDDLRLRVSLEYQGDLKPLVAQLARTAGYTVQIYGRSKSLVPVSIITDNREIGLILADVDYQSSWRVDVFVVPDQRVIELRYNRKRPGRRER